MLALGLVQTIAELFTGFKERHKFLGNRDRCAGARITALTRGAVLDCKSPKAAQLNPITARQRIDDFVEDDVDDPLDIPVVKMRIRGR